MLRALIVAAVGLAFWGCSSQCDFRKGSLNGAESRCQERVGSIAAEAFKGACKAAGGVSGDGTCPRDGVVGGCFLGAQGDGSKVNDWYYAPMTVEQVKRECGSDTFLDP